MVLSLEGEAERHDEGVLYTGEDLFLAKDGVRLVLRDEDTLVDDLDGVEALALTLLCQQHHPKAASAEETEDVKVADPDDSPVVALQGPQGLVLVGFYEPGDRGEGGGKVVANCAAMVARRRCCGSRWPPREDVEGHCVHD